MALSLATEIDPNKIDAKLDASNLQTSGGIPYLLVDGYPTGTFEPEAGSFTEQYIIAAGNLLAFVQDTYPNPTVLSSGIAFVNQRRMPGMPSAITRSVSFEPFPSGLPVDPFFADPRHSASTPAKITSDYARHLKLTIQYAVDVNNTDPPDPQDPESFLEVSATAAGEYLNVPGHEEPVSMVQEKGTTPKMHPFLLTVPEIEWTVSWKVMTDSYFRDFLLPEMRVSLGKVNSAKMNRLLYSAPAETLLFVGWSMRQVFTWRFELANVLTGAPLGKPFVSADLKFIEKNVGLSLDRTKGTVTRIGHNHGWKAGEGWVRMYRDVAGTKNLYETSDLNLLFNPPQPADVPV